MEEKLNAAIKKNDFKSLKELLDEVDINEQFKYPIGCENKSYGYSIPWTILQHAAAVGNQEVVNFLIEQGSDTNIEDKCGRTAQQIAEFLKKKVIVESKEFKSFIDDPVIFFKKMNVNHDTKKQIFKKFHDIYQKFIKNIKDNDDLKEMMINRIGKSTNSEIIKMLNDIDSLKKHYKQEFIEVVSKSNKFNKIIFLAMANKVDDHPNSNQEEISKLVYQDLFIEWSENKSEFVKQVDDLLNFKEMSKKNLNPMIFKSIRSGEISNVDYSEFFPEIEEFFEITEKYFTDDEQPDAFVSYYDWKKEIKTLKKENELMKEEMKKEINTLKEENEFLKSDENNISEYVPSDGFMIEQ
eukprot:gene12935-7516_t